MDDQSPFPLSVSQRPTLSTSTLSVNPLHTFTLVHKVLFQSTTAVSVETLETPCFTGLMDRRRILQYCSAIYMPAKIKLDPQSLLHKPPT